MSANGFFIIGEEDAECSGTLKYVFGRISSCYDFFSEHRLSRRGVTKFRLLKSSKYHSFSCNLFLLMKGFSCGKYRESSHTFSTIFIDAFLKYVKPIQIHMKLLYNSLCTTVCFFRLIRLAFNFLFFHSFIYFNIHNTWYVLMYFEEIIHNA